MKNFIIVVVVIILIVLGVVWFKNKGTDVTPSTDTVDMATSTATSTTAY